MANICERYCGVTCVDGSCPIANRDEYAERGYDVIRDCDECIYYAGCEDCAFAETDICPEFKKESTEVPQ